MRLLIIGDAVSQFIINFAISLKVLDNKVLIDIINVYPISNKKLAPIVKDIYEHVYNDQPLFGFIEKIPKLRGFVRSVYSEKVVEEVKKNVPVYDVIILHGFFPRNCVVYQKINTQKIFSLGVIWGSDFYKRGKNKTLVFKTMDLCDRVNISTNDMIRQVLEVKNISKNKIRSCLFGLAPLEILFKNPQLTSKEAKRILKLDENDFIITCGYNGRANQQHLEIIKSITDIKDQLPANYKLVFQMTYGSEDIPYQKEVKELLYKSKLEYIIYENFMTNEMIAYLRKATNIFIQTQRTDAFSGSMQEHLFAQSIVITGEWLPYQSLKEKGIYYETIDSMTSLPKKLSEVINNYEEIHEIVRLRNTSEKFRASLWSECIKDWYNVLSEYKISN